MSERKRGFFPCTIESHSLKIGTPKEYLDVPILCFSFRIINQGQSPIKIFLPTELILLPNEEYNSPVLTENNYYDFILKFKLLDKKVSIPFIKSDFTSFSEGEFIVQQVVPKGIDLRSWWNN